MLHKRIVEEIEVTSYHFFGIIETMFLNKIECIKKEIILDVK